MSQISDAQLRNNCRNDAIYWKQILKLTDSEIEKLTDILYTYEASVRDLPKDVSNYRENLEKIDKKRIRDLNGLLGSNRYRTYTAINQSSEDSMREMVLEIKSAMQHDSAFIRDLSRQIWSMYPVLIRYHQELMNEMTKEDYFALKSIKENMFQKLDSINHLNINIIDTIDSQKELPLETKSNLNAITNIIDKYKEEYQKIYIPLSEHQQKWNRELGQIVLKHYPESNVDVMKEYGLFFRKMGINKELDRMLIFMLDPEDERRYFQIMMIIQKIEEKIFLIHN
jgi:hypothetical protein